MRRSLSAIVLATSMNTYAAEPAPADEAVAATRLDAVTVTASKAERQLSELPASASVITADEMQRNLVEDIRDLVRYEPGIAVPYQGSRFGLGGFNIRGLGGNRVQIEVDGISISDAFSIGSFSNAGRDFVDIDTLKRVEILRGAASSLYGSDALGGVVSFITKDPEDYLERSDGNFTVGLRSGYFTADSAFVNGATLAGRSGDWSAVLSYVRRDGNELDNQGDAGGTGPSRTEPNPHDFLNQNLLAKLLYGERGKAPLKLTLETNDSDGQTDALTAVGPAAVAPGAPTTTTVDGQRADDEARRRRVSLEQNLSEGGWYDTALWRVYLQDSRTQQDTFEARTVTTTASGAISQRERERRALFEQKTLGGELTFTNELTLASIRNRLIWGLELERTETEQSRNGLERNLTAGTQTNVVQPDVFPVRDFPISTTLQAGIYAQDDVLLDRWTLVPGLRVDHYDLDPKPDAIFTEDNPGVESQGLTKTNVSPKFGVIFAITPALNAYGQYTRGFRAPPYNDVNIGFTNLAFGYKAIANPDLKPETSNDFELGLRGENRDAGFSLAAFYNRYKDFIESTAFLRTDENGLTVFQSQNLSRVRIYGVEFKGHYALQGISTVLRDFSLQSSAAWTRGDDESADQPLNSVQPLSGVLGLEWAPPSLPLSLELAATAVDGKTRISTASSQFRSPGYLRLDLLAEWRIPHGEINVGLFNLADRKIYPWSDVQGRAANDVAIDRFTQPGINAGINIRWQL